MHTFCFLNRPNYKAVVLSRTLLVKWFYFAWHTDVVTELDKKSRGCVTQLSSQLLDFCILTSIFFSDFVILFSAAAFGRKE